MTATAMCSMNTNQILISEATQVCPPYLLSIIVNPAFIMPLYNSNLKDVLVAVSPGFVSSREQESCLVFLLWFTDEAPWVLI